MAAVHTAFPPSNPPGSAFIATASLYIGDLHPSVTENILYDEFAKFKSLSSVRLCKDTSTGRSLCYGYANFLSRQEAKFAIEEKNHSILNGKMIRVMWSVREPDARKNGVGNVFVKNLPESINNASLQDLFKKFGNIVSCKVATFDDGKPRGYGFVQFEQEDAAHAAIEQMNGLLVAEKEIYVGKFMRKTDRVKPEVKYTNLYMKNLDADVTEDLLREKFSEFGKIVSLAVAKDENGSCKGYAFVNYDKPEDAIRAAETLNGTQFGSKSLYVGRAQKKAEREQLLKEQFEEKCKEQKMKSKVSNIYVKNIDAGVTEEELSEHFGKCGKITSTKIMRSDNGISKGFGFVCFSTPKEANDAVKSFHGHTFHGKPLYVAIAQTKEERKMQLQVKFGKRVVGGSSSSASIVPWTYPPLYYTNSQSGMAYQAVTYPPMVPYLQRQNKQNSGGRLNGNAVSYMPHGSRVYQSTQTLPLTRDFTNYVQKHQNKSYGRAKEMKKGMRKGKYDTQSSMPFTAPSEMQKQMIGEWVYSCVLQQEPQLAKKITGMLLEMDYSDLLSLMQSPAYLAVKVSEAKQVLLKSSKKSSNTLPSGILSS